MKVVAQTRLIICFVALGFSLIGIGCSGQQKEVEIHDIPPEEEFVEGPNPLKLGNNNRGNNRLDGYMSDSESLTWLKNNGYHVKKRADGYGYIITRNHQGPTAGSHDKFYGEIKGHFTFTTDDNVTIGNDTYDVTMIIDGHGHLRVKVNK